jgi:hypothetical protein
MRVCGEMKKMRSLNLEDFFVEAHSAPGARVGTLVQAPAFLAAKEGRPGAVVPGSRPRSARQGLALTRYR